MVHCLDISCLGVGDDGWCRYYPTNAQEAYDRLCSLEYYGPVSGISPRSPGQSIDVAHQKSRIQRPLLPNLEQTAEHHQLVRRLPEHLLPGSRESGPRNTFYGHPRPPKTASKPVSESGIQKAHTDISSKYLPISGDGIYDVDIMTSSDNRGMSHDISTLI
jgi:hypothetical protein